VEKREHIFGRNSNEMRFVQVQVRFVQLFDQGSDFKKASRPIDVFVPFLQLVMSETRL